MLKASLLLVVLLIVGCGSGSGDASKSAPAASRAWTEQQVIAAAGLTTRDNGITYQSARCDQVAQILNTRQEVELYSGAGDTVVTNPAGTAGVKVVGADAACMAELKRGLATLK